MQNKRKNILVITILLLGFISIFYFKKQIDNSIWDELKAEVAVRVDDLPFSPVEYKKLLAINEQTELGIRKSWKDNLEQGEMRKVINSIDDDDGKIVLTNLVLANLRATERWLRNITDKATVLNAVHLYGDLLQCEHLFGLQDGNDLSDALDSACDSVPNFNSALLFSGRAIKFQIIDGGSLKTKEECIEKYK